MLMYTLFPVIGGRYFSSAMEICTTYRYGLFTRAMALIYTLSPHHGGAFPSSHVAIAIICNIALGQYRPRYGWYLLPVTILLCVSTVYCHYHYAVDVAAGVVSGFGLSVLSSRIYVKRHAKVSRDLATTNLEFGK
jgi:membrane-associated phospholipid phosphatase